MNIIAQIGLARRYSRQIYLRSDMFAASSLEFKLYLATNMTDVCIVSDFDKALGGFRLEYTISFRTIRIDYLDS